MLLEVCATIGSTLAERCWNKTCQQPAATADVGAVTHAGAAANAVAATVIAAANVDVDAAANANSNAYWCDVINHYSTYIMPLTSSAGETTCPYSQPWTRQGSDAPTPKSAA